MPFQIVRQDITTISCDVIVAPTDSRYSGSGGTDYAVHRAAGPGLTEACLGLPPLEAGEVAVTEGFALPCRHIIHTKGPEWNGGGENEAVLLRSCYLNALFAARRLKAASIAFPLISSGAFGFPKDKVLRIATDAISDFMALSEEELSITLCVYDPDAYTLRNSTALADFLGRSFPGSCECICQAEACGMSEPMREPMQAMPMMSAPAPAPVHRRASAKMPLRETLADWIHHQDDSFAVMLLKLIDQKQMTEVECYKKANVSKKTFWKINNDPKYRPSKATVLAFAIALELTLEETEQLLKTVGFTLSHSNTFDMIIEFYITRGIYDIFEINAALYQYDQICLGC